jgi:hypothetical protein
MTTTTRTTTITLTAEQLEELAERVAARLAAAAAPSPRRSRVSERAQASDDATLAAMGLRRRGAR